MRPEFANERLTPNFSLWEFLESRFFTDDQQNKVYSDYSANKHLLRPEILKLAENLQVLRNWLGASVSINISYRPKWYELEKGRSGNSQHCQQSQAQCQCQNEQDFTVFLYAAGHRLRRNNGIFCTVA